MRTKGSVISGIKARWYPLIQKFRLVGFIYKRLVALVEVRDANCRILDVGCGPGDVLFMLRKRSGKAAELFGVDASEDMIAVAERRDRIRGAGVDFRVSVAETLPFPDEYFDIVVSSLVFHHLPRATKEHACREIFRVMKSGGTTIISDLGRPSTRLGYILALVLQRHEFTADNMLNAVPQSLVKSGFRNVETVATQVGFIEHIRAHK